MAQSDGSRRSAATNAWATRRHRAALLPKSTAHHLLPLRGVSSRDRIKRATQKQHQTLHTGNERRRLGIEQLFGAALVAIGSLAVLMLGREHKQRVEHRAADRMRQAQTET